MIDLDEGLLVERYGRRIDWDFGVSALAWLDDVAWFACGDGAVRRADFDGDYKLLAVHAGAIMSAVVDPDGATLLTGGDDGRLLRLSRDGGVEELGSFGRYWIEQLVVSPQSGIIVAGVGKEAVVWKRGQCEAAHRFGFPSTVGGLAFDAKGKRLAVTHYGGASLIFANSADSRRVEMKWGGSHLACTLAPDGGYLVTAMQETGLHGWQLPQMTDMQMSGYRAKTRSFSWSKRGKWLATSGDISAIIWPFEGKTGPMGKQPLLLGTSGSLVTCVAFNPRHDILAAGYADGTVSLLQLHEDGSAAVENANGDPVTALGWRGDGNALAWGCENGRAGLIEMNRRPTVSKAA